MTAIRQCLRWAQSTHKATAASLAVFLRDVGHGMLEVSHNTLALLGLVLVALAMFAASRDDLREAAEIHALGWLQARQAVREEPVAAPAPAPAPVIEVGEPDAVARATASDPKALNRPQAAVAQWLARRYRVAPEPISRLVQEAWHVGERAGLDPTLILAIMAVESSFNPFAQSAVGAQGLMQVMTKVHDDKYEAFGGNLAAFDPVTNLRVGVQVLKECISRAGSLEAGLRSYVGAGNLTDDGGYAGRVLAEQTSLRQVAGGKSVPVRPPAVVATTLPASAASGAPAPAPVPAAPVATPEESAPSEKIALWR